VENRLPGLAPDRPGNRPESLQIFKEHVAWSVTPANLSLNIPMFDANAIDYIQLF
jgi:hypothetical protein